MENNELVLSNSSFFFSRYKRTKYFVQTQSLFYLGALWKADCKVRALLKIITPN